MEVLDWGPEGNIGEAAGLIIGGKLFDMLITKTAAGFETDVVDGGTVVWRGILPTVEAAKAEAIVQARRATFRTV